MYKTSWFFFVFISCCIITFRGNIVNTIFYTRNKKPFFTNLRYLEFTMLKLGTPRLFLAWIKEKFVIFLMGSLFFCPSPIAQTWDLLAFQFQSIAVWLAQVIAWPCLKKYWIYQSYCKFHSNVSGPHKFKCGSGSASATLPTKKQVQNSKFRLQSATGTGISLA